MSVDTYNLPIGILGLHPEEFYGAMGRIVCISAVLEDKITSLRHALARVEQGRHTQEPVSQQITKARKLAADLPPPASEQMCAFLDRAEKAFGRRNEFIHSSFPSQPSGKVFGHRPTRNKAMTDGAADVVQTSIDEMKLLIGELAELVHSFNPILALCSGTNNN